MRISTEALDTSAVTAAKATTYGGAVTAVTAGGLSVSEMAAIIGALVAIAGLIFGQYWSWRKDQREAQLLRLQAEALRAGKDVK